MHLCFWNIIFFCKTVKWCTHQDLNHSKRIRNEEDMELELERGLELCFQKNWCKRTLFLCLLCCFVTCDAQRTFVILQFAHPMTQKSLWIWFKHEKNLGNCSMVGRCSMMGSFIPSCPFCLCKWQIIQQNSPLFHKVLDNQMRKGEGF